MKLLTRSIIICVMLLTSMGGMVFAQDSCEGVCTNAPEELDLYLKTMVKLINEIPTTEKPSSGEDISTLPIADKIANDKKLMSSVLSKTLITHKAVPDIFGEMKILQQGAIRKRDRDKILDVDEKIMRRLGVSVKKGWSGEEISNNDLEKIDVLFKELKWVRLQTFDDGGYVMLESGVTWDQYASLLWQMNGLFKEFHKAKRYHENLKDTSSGYLRTYTENVEDMTLQPVKELVGKTYHDVDQLVDRFMSPLTSGKVGRNIDRLHFEDDRRVLFIDVWAIQQAYVCATGVKQVCDSGEGSWAKAAENSREYTKERWNKDGNRAIDTFKRSWSRLKGALYTANPKDEAAAEQRKNQLLQSIYGRDVPQREKRRQMAGVNIEENVESAPMTRQAVVNLFKRIWKNEKKKTQNNAAKSDTNIDLDPASKEDNQVNDKTYHEKDDKKKLVDELKEYTDANKKYEWTNEDVDLRSFLNTSQTQREIYSFRNTYMSVIDLQAQFEEQSVLLDANPVTKRFPALSAAVYKNMDLFGEKNDGNKGTDQGIYDAMGRVCEIQCSNLQGRCWYHTD